MHRNWRRAVGGSPQRKRHNQRKASTGFLKLLELTSPLDIVARRQRHVLRNRLPSLFDETAHVAPAHVALHHQPPFDVLSAGLSRAGFDASDSARLISLRFDDAGDHQVAYFRPLDHDGQRLAAERAATPLVAVQRLGSTFSLDWQPRL